MAFRARRAYAHGVADSILLGHAPRPTDGAQLAKRIRTLVIAAEPAGIACTSIIDAELDGADIARLHLDLTDFILAGESDRDRARRPEPDRAHVDGLRAAVPDAGGRPAGVLSRQVASQVHSVRVPADSAASSSRCRKRRRCSSGRAGRPA